MIDAAEVVVVGDPVPTHRPVTFTREDPRHGGPVAALLTGRDALLDPRADRSRCWPCDMPFLTAQTLPAAAGTRPAATTARSWSARTAAVSSPWCSTWPAWTPYDRASRSQHGLALHRLLAALDLAEVPAEGREHRDVDTWADVRDLTS